MRAIGTLVFVDVDKLYIEIDALQKLLLMRCLGIHKYLINIGFFPQGNLWHANC